MHKLPSQQKEAIEKAKNEFKKNGKLTIHEPCNCGSQVRHNNGGNYHEIVKLAFDSNKFFRKYDTTSELTPEAEWNEITEEETYETIEQLADWL